MTITSIGQKLVFHHLWCGSHVVLLWHPGSGQGRQLSSHSPISGARYKTNDLDDIKYLCRSEEHNIFSSEIMHLLHIDVVCCLWLHIATKIRGGKIVTLCQPLPANDKELGKVTIWQTVNHHCVQFSQTKAWDMPAAGYACSGTFHARISYMPISCQPLSEGEQNHARRSSKLPFWGRRRVPQWCKN